MIEEWDKNEKRTEIRTKENTEERRKRKRDDENFPSPTNIPAAIPAKEMTSSRCLKLPNGRLSLHPPSHVRIVVILRLHRGVTKSLCRITTTTTEGPENPSSGSKKKTEELCELMKKKHAMECAKLLQEYEEGKQRDPESENEANEEVEARDQGLKIKIEEILPL